MSKRDQGRRRLAVDKKNTKRNMELKDRLVIVKAENMADENPNKPRNAEFISLLESGCMFKNMIEDKNLAILEYAKREEKNIQIIADLRRELKEKQNG